MLSPKGPELTGCAPARSAAHLCEFRPFLPLLPVQILLNNLLYDMSEIGIPFDRVDDQDLSRPQAWDMGAILRFTLIMGGLS